MRRLIVAVFTILITRSAGAQADTAAAVRDTGRVAVRIVAEASAREVRFAAQPTLHVRLAGDLDSVHVLARRNLDSPVVAGRTYKDVYVAVEIFGRVNADCIARRLGVAASPSTPSDSSCASLELRGAASRPPPATTRSPWR